jgi:hypothetical protein
LPRKSTVLHLCLRVVEGPRGVHVLIPYFDGALTIWLEPVQTILEVARREPFLEGIDDLLHQRAESQPTEVVIYLGPRLLRDDPIEILQGVFEIVGLHHEVSERSQEIVPPALVGLSLDDGAPLAGELDGPYARNLARISATRRARL